MAAWVGLMVSAMGFVHYLTPDLMVFYVLLGPNVAVGATNPVTPPVERYAGDDGIVPVGGVPRRSRVRFMN